MKESKIKYLVKKEKEKERTYFSSMLDSFLRFNLEQLFQCPKYGLAKTLGENVSHESIFKCGGMSERLFMDPAVTSQLITRPGSGRWSVVSGQWSVISGFFSS